MNRLKNFTNLEVISKSMTKSIVYLLKNEVVSFVELECAEDHIFVDVVIAGELGNSPMGSPSYKIFDLTNQLVNKFDEDLANELVELVESISELDEN